MVPGRWALLALGYEHLVQGLQQTGLRWTCVMGTGMGVLAEERRCRYALTGRYHIVLVGIPQFWLLASSRRVLGAVISS